MTKSLEHPAHIEVTELASTTDGRFFMPTEDPTGEALKDRIRSSRPSDEEIEEAHSKLAQIFNGDDSALADARFRKGMSDLLAKRDTEEAEFYVKCEQLASVANCAFDILR